jgi:hypothetical protein
MAGFGALVFGSQVVVLLVSGHWAALGLAAFIAVWATGFLRNARIAVLSTSDGRLLVRNQLRTTVLERAQIQDVRRSAGGFLGPRRGALLLVRADGTSLTLEATARAPLAGRRRATEQEEQVRRWLAG